MDRAFVFGLVLFALHCTACVEDDGRDSCTTDRDCDVDLVCIRIDPDDQVCLPPECRLDPDVCL